MEKYQNNINNFAVVRKDKWNGYVHKSFEEFPLELLVIETTLDNSRSDFKKVTSSDTAKVYRYSVKVQEQEYCLYLKKYPHRSLLDAVKHLFRPSRAKRAFNAGIMLEKYGLHTPQIVAFLQKKERWLPDEDILITQEMNNAKALQFHLNSNEFENKKDKREMIKKLGETIGRMHAEGICHGDMRGGNVFVTKESNQWRFIFIDNERTVKYPVLPFWLRPKNLVQLNMLQNNVSATDRIRFLKAYKLTAGISKNQSKNLTRIVLKKTSKRLKRRAKTRTGLTISTKNTHWNFQMARLGDNSGIFLTNFAKADIASKFLNQIDYLMDTGHVLKDDVSTRVVRSEYNNWNIVIKRYNYQGLWHSLRHTIKGSRAKKCWRFGHLLTAANIPCAAPLGIVEEKRFGIIWKSYIINEFVAGPLLYVPMNDPNYSPQKRQLIIEKAEQVLEKLGENLLTHSDMKASNLIISNSEPVLIDLDSMRQHRNKGPYFKNRYEKMLCTFHRRLDGRK